MHFGTVIVCIYELTVYVCKQMKNAVHLFVPFTLKIRLFDVNKSRCTQSVTICMIILVISGKSRPKKPALANLNLIYVDRDRCSTDACYINYHNYYVASYTRGVVTNP